MAAPAFASSRRQQATYRNRSRSKPSEDPTDIFGVPRSPSPNAPGPHASATKTSFSNKPVRLVNKRPIAETRKDAKAVAATMDIYDLPSSGDEDTSTKSRLVGNTRAPKQASTRTNVIKSQPVGTGSKENVRTASERFSLVAASRKRSRETSHTPIIKPTARIKRPKPESRSLEFPDSSGEEPQEAALSFDSKPAIGTKATNPAKRQKSVEPTNGHSRKPSASSRVARSMAVASSSKPRSESSRRSSRQVSQEPVVKSQPQPTDLSLPHREARRTTSRPMTQDISRSIKHKTGNVAKKRLLQTNNSAPAILSQMIEQRTSSVLPKSSLVLRSPSPMQIDVDMVMHNTPSPQRLGSSERIVQDIQQTPKQRALWGRLLDTLTEVDSPSDLRVSDLSLTSTATKPTTIDHQSSKRVSDTSRKRVKLIKTLRTTSKVIEKPEELEHDSSSDDSCSEADSALESGTFREANLDTHQDEESIEDTTRAHVKTFKAPARTTYSQQRSYLADQTEEDMLDAMIEDMSQPLMKSLEASQKDELDLESDNDDGEGAGQPKSAHDLRAAGSKKRMLQDLENLVSGLQNDSLGLSSRRADMTEIVTMLLSQSSVELILDHGMDRQLVTSFTNSKDAVFDFIASCCLGLVVRCTKQLAVLRGFSRAGCIEKLFEVLQNDKSVASITKERRTNMSGIAQRKVLALADSIVASELWPSKTVNDLSPQLIALRLLELIIRGMRELGADDILIDEARLIDLLEVLESHHTSQNKSVYAWLVFSILESISVGNYSLKRGPWTSRTLKAVIKQLAWILTQVEDDLKPARRLALAVSMNLTNDNPKACDAFAKPDLIVPVLYTIVRNFENISEAELDDDLILCLGTMINMAETSEHARLCVLTDGSVALTQMVSLFCTRMDQSQTATSIETMRHNVPFGYMALLLVNLCQTDAVRTEILQSLPSSEHLNGLIAAAEEFITIHQQTDLAMLNDRENDIGEAAAHAEYTRRLRAMVDRLKETIP